MVNAVHSSTTRTENGLQAMGSECGFVIEAEGRTIYVSGDTDVMADMALFNDASTEIGIWPAGGISPWTCGERLWPTSSLTLPICHYRLPHS